MKVDGFFNIFFHFPLRQPADTTLLKEMSWSELFD
mgnify:CR=1 FL=1